MNGSQTSTQTLAQVGGSQLRLAPGRFDANLSLSLGQVLAQVTAAAVNPIITFTVTNTPTAGSITYTWYGKLLVIPFNCTAAALDALVKPLLGVGNYAIAGGAWPGSALTLELKGIYASLTPVLPVQSASTLNASATVAVTLSQSNVPFGKLVTWDGTKIAAPSAILSAAANAAVGTWLAGVYTLSYTWVTANGETTPSPASALTLTLNQSIRVAAINAAGTPDAATALNVYVNGMLAKSIAVSTPGTAGNVAQTDIGFYDSAISAVPPPTVNTALTAANGKATFVGFNLRQLSTDAAGQAFNSTVAMPSIAGVSGQGLVEYVQGGIIDQASIVGVSDWTEFLRQTNARILSGSVAGGNAVFAISPIGPQ